MFSLKIKGSSYAVEEYEICQKIKPPRAQWPELGYLQRIYRTRIW